MSADLLPLRDYQRQAIDAVFRAHADGMRRPAVVLSTGAGKTVIFSHMASEFHARTGRRVLVLVHRDELADQALAKLRAIAPHLSAGKVKAGENQVDAHVVVASVQTIVRPARMASLLESQQRYRSFGLVITDECHHGVAPSYQRIYAALPDAVHAGFTATMARGDGIGLGSVWEDVVYTKSLAYMISKGYLVQPVGRSVAVDDLDLSAVKQSRGDYQSGSLGSALEESHALAQIAVAYRAYAADRPGVVFTPTVATAHGAAKELEALGLRSAVVTGETPRDERRRIFADYAARRVQVLANCMVLCLDMQTEILTDRGWTTHDQMTMDHRVANWDQGSVFFKEPHEVVIRDRGPQEDMYVLETVRRSIRVTGGHRMLYRTTDTGRFLKAPVENLVGRAVTLPTTGFASPEHRSELTLDQCRLIGFWTGDGSLGHPGGGVEYTMSQSVAYPEIIRWVDGVLDRTGIDYRRRDKSHYPVPCIRWSLPRGTGHGSQKRNGVVAFEGYLDKGGSEQLWDLDTEQFRAYLEGLWYADGDHGQALSGLPDSFQIYACNLGLLERVQAIASVRGWTCALRKDTAPRNDRSRQLYRLSFRTRPGHKMGGTDSRYRIQRENASWTPEKVWCVRTETKNIITRRHGSVTVMGNTEGWDAPLASCAVIARPTASQPLYVQMVGRVLRPFPGKADALVLDVVGASETNKLATLVDLEEGLFPERKPCRTCWEVPCVCPCKGCGGPKPCKVCVEEEGSGAAADLVLKGTGAAIDLFASSRSAWLQTRRGVWFIPTGDGHVVLWPQADGAWTVADVPKAGAWQRLHEGVDLEAAMSWGEVEAEDRDDGPFGSIANRGASWRRRKTAPSQAQLDKAARLRIVHAPDVTKAELSDMISVAVASRLIDPYVPAPQV